MTRRDPNEQEDGNPQGEVKRCPQEMEVTSYVNHRTRTVKCKRPEGHEDDGLLCLYDT